MKSYEGKGNINIKPFEIFIVVYIIALLFVYLVPSIKYAVSYPISAMLLLIPLFFIFLQSSKMRNYILRLIFCSVCIGVIYYFVTYPLDSVMAINEIILIVRYFAPAVLFVYLAQRSNRTTIKWIFNVITIIMIYIMIKTIIEVEENPLVVRILAQGDRGEDLMLLRNKNIGGFGFAYSIGVIIPFLFNLLWEFKNKLIKFILISSLIFCFIFVFKAQYTLLLLLSVLSIILVLYLRIKHPAVKIIIILSTLVVPLIIGSLFSYLATIVEGPVFVEKFSMLATLFSVEGGTTANIGTRPDHLMDAFKLFLQSPIWGNTRIYEGQVFFPLLSHSTILEKMSLTGIFGLLLYIYIIYITYQVIANMYKKIGNDMKLFNVSFVYFCILSFVNPTHQVFEIAIILFLYIPLGIWLFYTSRWYAEK